jgi:hypothetical protein
MQLREKVLYLCADLWSFHVSKSCNQQNILGPQIANSDSATLSEGPQIYKTI